jgi:hypothetical protein
MLHYLIGGSVITIIGSNLLNTLVAGTMDVIYNSASFVKNGTESNKDIAKIKNEIEIMDIPVKLQLVKSLMDNATPGPIITIIETGLLDLIYKIKSLIETIDYEIVKHRAKWFAGYRSVALDDKVAELNKYVNILDGRITLLMNFNTGKL